MIIFLLKIACKKYEAAIQMLQDMNDRSSTTLAMLGLIKSLLALDTQTQMVREKIFVYVERHSAFFQINILIILLLYFVD